MREKVKLKKWPFDPDERVTVHWFSSPSKNNKKKWYFDVVFKDTDGQLVPVSYPWGLFHYFEIGDIFMDGSKDGRLSTLIKKDISIDTSRGEICTAFKIPKWIYPLQEKSYLEEKCIYYTGTNQEIYVPCFEVARSLFCKTAFLTKALLVPQGLNKLIDEYTEINAQTIKLYLNNNIPSNLLTKEVVMHLAWLYFDKKVRNVWELVSQNAYSSIESGSKFMLSLPMPFNGKLDLTALVLEQESYYSVKYKRNIPKRTVIMEIISVNNIKPRYKYVDYDHVTLAKREPGNSSGTKRSDGEQESWTEEEYFIGEEDTKSDTANNKQILQSFLPTIQFEEEVIVHRVPSKSRTQNTNGKKESTVNKPVQTNLGEKLDETEKKEVGINDLDTDVNGESLHVEFRPVNASTDIMLDGLENFQKALWELSRKLKDNAKVNWIKYELPIVKDRTYSYINGIQARRFILAKIAVLGVKNQYILEVGNPDRENIYTLLFGSFGGKLSDSTILILVGNLLVELINNEGHWNEEKIDNHTNLTISRLKHYKKNRNPLKWAKYLQGKISTTPKI